MDFPDLHDIAIPQLGKQYNETRIMDYISHVNNTLPEGEKWPEDIDYLMTGVSESNFPYNNLSALSSKNIFHEPFKKFHASELMQQNRKLMQDLVTQFLQFNGNAKNAFTPFECARATSNDKDTYMIENRRHLLIAFLGHLIRQLRMDDEIVAHIRIPSTPQSARYIAGSSVPVEIIAARHFMNTLTVFDSPGFRILFDIDEDKHVSAPHAIYMHGIKAYGYIDLLKEDIRLWFSPSDLFWTNLTHQYELWLPVCAPVPVPSLWGTVYPTRFIDPYSGDMIQPFPLSPGTKEQIARYSYLLTLICQTLSLLARTIASSQGTRRSTWTPDSMNAGIRKMVLVCAALDHSFPQLTPDMEF